VGSVHAISAIADFVAVTVMKTSTMEGGKGANLIASTSKKILLDILQSLRIYMTNIHRTENVNSWQPKKFKLCRCAFAGDQFRKIFKLNLNTWP
jgi:hypothetical protein